MVWLKWGTCKYNYHRLVSSAVIWKPVIAGDQFHSALLDSSASWKSGPRSSEPMAIVVTLPVCPMRMAYFCLQIGSVYPATVLVVVEGGVFVSLPGGRIGKADSDVSVRRTQVATLGAYVMLACCQRALSNRIYFSASPSQDTTQYNENIPGQGFHWTICYSFANQFKELKENIGYNLVLLIPLILSSCHPSRGRMKFNNHRFYQYAC